MTVAASQKKALGLQSCASPVLSDSLLFTHGIKRTDGTGQRESYVVVRQPEALIRRTRWTEAISLQTRL